jgi:excinuclease ABC subunit C
LNGEFDMDQKNFISIQQSLPNAPGIYKYFDINKKLLYIGKAKNIRKRVSSYFNKNQHSYKTHELVKQIQHIEFTIVHSEHDALLLENALIKEFRPKFNIELKDDKTYPFIVIKNEAFPRVFLTRRHIQDGSTYIGPFTSSTRVRELLSFIKQHIPIRTCSLNLSPSNISKKKYKVCLEYHLGNCKGPCTGLQSESEYEDGLNEIKHILKGNLSGILNQYRSLQTGYIEDMAFEKAAMIQKKIEGLKNYQSNSVIVNPKWGDLDVFATSRDEKQIVVSYLLVRNGSIANSGTHAFDIPLDETEEDVLAQSILHFQKLYNSEVRELILPYRLEYGFSSFRLTVPKSGEKKKLLDIAMKNAGHLIEDLKKKRLLHLDREINTTMLLERLRDVLYLQEIPSHIECFDNSNFQGSNPVSAMVCFRDGIPSKKDYRHFNVKTVSGINDFATMKEAVGRRYSRLIREKSSLPQLVIIDGGKGQLSAAMEAIQELELTGRMTLIGLAKNVEEIFFAGDKDSLKLPYNSEELLLIRRIRDEVHRFGISFHRNKRSKSTFKNSLDDIEGIGEKTINLLLSKYRSLSNIKKANQEELEQLIGPSKARILDAFFNK